MGITSGPPKTYFDNGRILIFGKDIPEDKFLALQEGEVFTLLNIENKPFSKVLMDSYGTIRERPITDDELFELMVKLAEAEGIEVVDKRAKAE
jgi:hypothetical protein